MRTKFFVTSAIVIATVIAGSFVYSPSRVSAQKDKFRRAERPISNRYIVVLNDTDDFGSQTNAAAEAADHARGFSMRIGKIYESALKGYSAEMSESEARRLSDLAHVSYVEEDSEVAASSTQANATWGLSRIDQRTWSYPQDTNYDYSVDGSGVNVYVVDTGVKSDHPDFNGRAYDAANTSGDNTKIEQCNGHGTHVAGTIGSTTFGVAKGATIYSVRVFPCWGNTPLSDVIAGVDWVTRHSVLPAVANMSLGTGYSKALNDSVKALIARGVVVTVAAGNDNRDACLDSPGSLPEALTVGSTDNRDYKSNSSNFGRCVDIFAPGVGIESIWNQDQYPVFIMSGSSTAAPHAAGVAALYLQANPTASPAEVTAAITDNATNDLIVGAGTGSPNRLLYSAFASPAEPDPPPSGCMGGILRGILESPGANKYESSQNGFSASSGNFRGTLSLPEEATFVLSLEQKKGRSWNTVASSPGTSSMESLTFKGKSGTYRWRVRSVYGIGDYALCSITP